MMFSRYLSWKNHLNAVKEGPLSNEEGKFILTKELPTILLHIDHF